MTDRKKTLRLLIVSGFGLATLPGVALAAALSAHTHGVGTINIAAEGKTATVEFIAPTLSLYGFEHPPSSEAEKRTQSESLHRLTTRIDEMIIFATERHCQFSVVAIADSSLEERRPSAPHAPEAHDDIHESHREVRAEFNVTCRQPLAGSRVRFRITQLFPTLQEITVQIVTENKQLGLTLKASGGSADL